MSESDILLEDASPVAPSELVLESDGETVYLYRWFERRGGERQMRSLWVRNLSAAPERLDPKRMEEGRAPLLPAAFVHTRGQGLPPRQPRLVWALDGVGAFLFDGAELVAVLPAGADDRLPGLSLDAAQPSPFAHPLGPVREQWMREASDAEAFWRSWEPAGEASPWPGLRSALLGSYERVLGPHGRYFAVESGQAPSRFLATFSVAGQCVLASGGVSVLVQPGAADGRGPRRIELGCVLDPQLAPGVLPQLMQFVSALSRLPWTGATFLAPGHTIPCGAFQQTPAERFVAMVLTDQHPAVPAITLPEYQGQTPQLLYLVPITAREHALARAEGSAALLERLRKAPAAWTDVGRPELG